MTDIQLGERVVLSVGDETHFETLLGIKEYEMHHRTQLFLMEQMAGIVPQLTETRQARQ